MTEKITLYQYWRSSCSWRVRWALQYKGISYQTKSVNLLKAEQKGAAYLKINPFGQVPALMVGKEILIDSMAILEWIEETHSGPSLLPVSPLERQYVRTICQMISSGIQPQQNMRFLKRLDQERAGLSEEIAREVIEHGFNAIERFLNQQQKCGRFCLGATLSMADLFVIPQCYNALRRGIKLEQWPYIFRIFQNATALPSCKASAPEAQPDAVK